MQELLLKRHSVFRGDVTLPGSKSIANRALLLSSLAQGKTILRGLPDADDVTVFRRNLPNLGIQATEMGDSLEIVGAGGSFPVQKADIFVENAGTAMRPLAAALCAGKGDFVIDGNEQMRRRPIGDLVRGLAELGVDITAAQATVQGKLEMVPPVTIHAKGIAGGRTRLSGNVSSQFISAVLLAAPLASKPLTLEVPGDPVSKPYIDMTISMMKQFGAGVRRERYSLFEIAPQRYISPGEFTIEGDASAATYFLSLGALSGPVTVRTIYSDSVQGDVRFADVLSRMGAVVTRLDDSITVKRGNLRGIDIDMNDMPDAAMTLAVLALFAEGPTHIRNIANLRVKESERIAGLASELRKLGAIVEEGHDNLKIVPPARIQSAVIETFQDHRMAMAFSLASFGADVTILDPMCVRKTYPAYFEDFKRVFG
ncbi:MAG: 3-phosphoshikimate 1-carboxyvinyltransferase [Leptospirales bacterium]|nr:3-phosphoshikimate 1-carboxyvinyltransferase [Leptospirales bacterium]HMZ38261.1 3-phosphoshikimate 1-carboxyvinyltransferase [Leptospiraceae bacterium]HNL01590.1 3-phosphoshikimate 1-carboxyvinyltransferase [Leptospiraceae bacterium]HNN60863.1 3-phosphoshikimate 1-carboxyvinyltransferase [Leptospiraceae bacterium]HNN74783.1 3-phosphoshikimate 1-carboxyvinyltransferase [Leptospiraceae bacterium]